MADFSHLSDEELLKLHKEMKRQKALSSPPPTETLQLEEDPSVTEALLRGGAQGLTFGFADEATGLAQALGEAALTPGSVSHADLKSLYEKFRDESRSAYKKAEEISPIASTIGDIGGSIIPALFTSGTSLGIKGGLAATKASLPRATAALAGQGAIAGYGLSEATESPEILKDIATGAAGATAVGGVLSGMGKAVKGAGKFLKESIGESKLGQDVARGWDVGYNQLKRAYGKEAAEEFKTKVTGETENLIRTLDDTLQMHSKLADELRKAAGDKQYSITDIGEKAIKRLDDLKSSGNLSEAEHADALQKVNNLVYQSMQNVQAEFTDVMGKSGERIGGTMGYKSKLPEEEIQDILNRYRSGELEPKSTTKKVSQKFEDVDGTPELKSTTETTNVDLEVPGPEQLRTPSELHDVKQKWQAAKFDGGKPTDKGDEALRTILSSEISDKLRTIVPETEFTDKNINSIMEAMRLSGVENADALFSLTKDGKRVKEVPTKFIELLKNMVSTGDVKDLARNDQFFRVLSSSDPQLANKMKGVMSKLAEEAEFFHRMGNETILASGLEKSFMGGTRTMTVGGVNLLGRKAGEVRKFALNTLPVEQLSSLAQKVGSIGPQGAELGRLLSEASTRDRIARNALLFSIEQNPTYRELLNQTLTEE